MATDNTIRTFTALDIEKYHRGLLSPKERHDLEKAALDDPFLADALEGYAIAGLDVETDIANLKKRLAERTTQAKVVSMHGGAGKTSFPWFRAAAMIILVAGAGLLIYQFAFNKKNATGIAQSKESKNNEDTALLNTNHASDVWLTTKDSAATNTAEVSFKNKGTLQKNSDFIKEIPAGSSSSLYRSDSIVLHFDVNATTAPVTFASPIAADKKTNIAFQRDSSINPSYDLSDMKKTAAGKRKEGKSFVRDKDTAAFYNSDRETEVAKAEGDVVLNEQQERQAVLNKTTLPNTNRKDNNQYYNYSNKFRGRVTDANDNGLPFANVTNVQDNVGTYTDAKGFFNLTSTDSILNVQVRSNGFNSNNIQLHNNQISNQVILQEDKSLAVQTLPPRKINTEQREQRRSRDDNMKLENEPEPEDGWPNYDSYLSNNLNIPDDALRGKQSGSGSVEVSFEVNKYGEPVNFKVEKSLCDKCDQEAIRLIKEGPKWKRKAKKGRTTVTISF
jgi:CarboxypepD_reg-like domain